MQGRARNRVPIVFQSCSNRVPIVSQSCSNRVPIVFQHMSGHIFPTYMSRHICREPEGGKRGFRRVPARARAHRGPHGGGRFRNTPRRFAESGARGAGAGGAAAPCRELQLIANPRKKIRTWAQTRSVNCTARVVDCRPPARRGPRGKVTRTARKCSPRARVGPAARKDPRWASAIFKSD